MSRDDRIAILLHGQLAVDGRVLRQVRALVDDGWKVDVFCLRGSVAGPDIGGVTIIEAPLSRGQKGTVRSYLFEYAFFLIWAMITVLAHHLRRGYRAVIANNMPNSLVLSALPLRLLGVKIGLDIHDPAPEVYEQLFSREWPLLQRALFLEERICGMAANSLLTVSYPMRDLVRTRIRRDAGVIHNAPNMSFDSVAEKEDRSRRGELHLLHHGHIHERSGIHRGIMTLDRMKGYQTRIQYNIHGGGPHCEALTRLVRERQLEDRCVFHGRFSPEDIPSILSGQDIVLALYEPSALADLLLPVKILEACFAGIPVIATRLRCLEYYFGEDMLWYVESDSDIDRVIIRIDEDYPSALQQAARARDRVDEFSWEKEQAHFVSWCRELTGVEQPSERRG